MSHVDPPYDAAPAPAPAAVTCLTGLTGVVEDLLEDLAVLAGTGGAGAASCHAAPSPMLLLLLLLRPQGAGTSRSYLTRAFPLPEGPVLSAGPLKHRSARAL